ncbi:MAG: B12-binding domain-containing radical SAM protein [Candidatus Eremiobacteraeota bacterium]|nr:B12-binding domain-containing radical SAM protein [Candidatus Eremiobacteraeota bacterium]
MERLRVLLINPPIVLPIGTTPTSSPPLGLAYLAGVLEKRFDVNIMDCIAEGINKRAYYSKGLERWGVDMDELNLRITRWEPDVVGISCRYSSQENIIYDIAKVYKHYAKIRSRNIVVVVGGPHASAVPWRIMENEDIDFVVIGEGEVPMFQLCRSLQTGSGTNNIEGLAFMDLTGKILVNPRSTYIDHPDQIPFPARHLLMMEKYKNLPLYFQPKTENHTNMLLSRGCDSHCTFCSVPFCFGNKFRPRSPENVLKEIQRLVERSNIQEIYFEDDNFFHDLDIAEQICEGIVEKGLNIFWSAQSGFVGRGYNNRLISLMKKSGCYNITLNIESGCDRVMSEVINGPNEINILLNMINALRNAGIGVSANFRVGFPGETKEEITRTFQFINTFKLENFNVHLAQPYPGTPMWEHCEKENSFIHEITSSSYLLEEYLIHTQHFEREDLFKIYETGMKSVWKKQVTLKPGMLIDSIGGLIDRHVLHPFTSKEKKRRGR